MKPIFPFLIMCALWCLPVLPTQASECNCGKDTLRRIEYAVVDYDYQENGRTYHRKRAFYYFEGDKVEADKDLTAKNLKKDVHFRDLKRRVRGAQWRQRSHAVFTRLGVAGVIISPIFMFLFGFGVFGTFSLLGWIGIYLGLALYLFPIPLIALLFIWNAEYNLRVYLIDVIEEYNKRVDAHNAK